MTDSYKLLVMAVGRWLGIAPRSASVRAQARDPCERCGSCMRMVHGALSCLGCGLRVSPDD